MTKYVEVNPSTKIFTELGYNTYEYIDLISELIDNSIAARIENQLLEVRIAIGDSKNPSRRFFKIKDNASGIPFEILGEAISPGARGEVRL
jgi:DNA gyrase/topoisomerase IV subunit B